MDKIDPSLVEPTDSNHPRLRRVNKGFILYSLLGIAAAAVIGSAMLPELFRRERKDRGKSTVNVPDPPQYDIEYPSDPVIEGQTAAFGGSFAPIPGVPDIEGLEEILQEGEPAAPASTQAPAPRAPSYVPSGFRPDFSADAAASSMAVNVEGTPPPLTLPGIGSQLQADTAAAARQLQQQAARVPSIAATIPNNRQPTQYEIYNQANQQTEKIAFAAPPGDPRIVDRLGPYSLAQGTIIPALLVTGINTDLPGYVMAQVSENVYDFVSGDNLLIPAGSRLVATYNSVVSWGQSRIQISWQQMIRPDGVVVNLSGAPGIDPAGFSGLPANVDNHSLEILGAIGFSALTTFLTGASDAAVQRLLTRGALSASLESVVANLGTIGFTIAQRWLNVQPTLTLDAGAKVNVFATNSVTLPPVPPSGETRKYIRRKK